VLSIAIGTWIFGMLKNAGLVHWAPFLFAPLSVALCGVLLSPIILRLREVESESSSLKQ
jgi:ABC-type branched-subunit amino acid transport system permease subunit